MKALPLVGKRDLLESIEQQEQQAQEQQQKVAELEQMQKELINSQTEQNIALAQERRARIVSDLSLGEERASEAEENRAQAALARAKTITEIADMDADRVLRVLEFVNQLERQEIEDRQAIDDRIEARANQLNSETPGTAENKQLQTASAIAGQQSQGLGQ